MLTRRTLLQMNAALFALPLASGVAAAAVDPRSPGLAGNVFFDDRVHDCNVFADHAGRAGAATRSIGDEITALAYEGLKPAMVREAGITAGLMPEPMAFLFEVMARDVGRQLALRGEHYYFGGKLVGHRIKAPPGLVNESAPLPGVAGNWTAELVDLLIRFDPATVGSAMTHARSSGDRVPQHDFKLVSWVIAPLPRA